MLTRSSAKVYTSRECQCPAKEVLSHDRSSCLSLVSTTPTQHRTVSVNISVTDTCVKAMSLWHRAQKATVYVPNNLGNVVKPVKHLRVCRYLDGDFDT